jgi:hypothetical protein
VPTRRAERRRRTAGAEEPGHRRRQPGLLLRLDREVELQVDPQPGRLGEHRVGTGPPGAHERSAADLAHDQAAPGQLLIDPGGGGRRHAVRTCEGPMGRQAGAGRQLTTDDPPGDVIREHHEVHRATDCTEIKVYIAPRYWTS